MTVNRSEHSKIIKEKFLFQLECMKNMKEIINMRQSLNEMTMMSNLTSDYIDFICSGKPDDIDMLKSILETDLEWDSNNLTEEFFSQKEGSVLYELEYVSDMAKEANKSYNESLKTMLEMVIESYNNFKEIENDYDKLNSDLDNAVKELWEERLDGKDITDFYRDTILTEKELLGIMKDEEINGNRKTLEKNIDKKLNSIENAFSFIDIKEIYINAQIRENTLKLMTNKVLRSDVLDKFTRVSKRLDLKIDLNNFKNLESKFLSEKFAAKNNLILFIIIRYINGQDQREDRYTKLFMSQLMLNLESLYAYNPNFTRKVEFLKSLEDLLEMFEK